MNTLKKLLIVGTCAGLALGVAKDSCAATLTAPPTVLFGRVIHIGQGSSCQVYEGTLVLEIVRVDDPAHIVHLETKLDRIGPGGEISYRLEIPVKHQPSADELSGSLAADFMEARYTFRSLAINGVPAAPLDPGQARFATSLANPADEHRLDLEVTLPQTDTDQDGLPDWWERQYGLNIHLAADATADSDGDGLDNLGEYHAGTDPTQGNTKPVIQSTHLEVPLGGQSGLFIGIVDLDTPPEKLQLTFDTIPVGLSIWNEEARVAEGESATYDQILAGLLQTEVADDFESGVLILTVRDQTTNGVSVASAIHIDAFSPATVALDKPSIWLDAETVTTPGSLSEWADRSGGHRDAYQPIEAWQPGLVESNGSGIAFSGGAFLFLDDRELDTHAFTAFLAFDVDALGDAQTILHSGDLEISIGGANQSQYAQSLKITGAGRQMRGPLVETGSVQQWTFGGGSLATYVTGGDGTYMVSSGDQVEDLNPAAFSTIGARHAIDASLPEAFLRGAVREVLLYNAELQPAVRVRNEDYQQSRWGSRLVWDERRQIAPLHVTGHPRRSNALTGGWGGDHLTGGMMHDILRGGPGDDVLTGGAGGDRFQFFKNHGNDTVKDFNPEEGDMLDLTGILGGQTGFPSDYVRFRQVIVRLPNALPRVDSVLDIDDDGAANGWTTHQSITLEGRAFGNQSLARLTGENSLLLGGPRFETSIEIQGPAGGILENGLPQPVTLVRKGNLDAAMDLAVSLTGDAVLGEDFHVAGPHTNSPVQSVRFERNQTEATLSLLPSVDTESETESIRITLMADSRITSGQDVTVEVPIVDVPLFAIETQQHAEAVEGGRRGKVRVRRGGPGLDQAVELDLSLGGTLIPGTEFSVFPSTAAFAPGETELEMTVLQGTLAPITNEVKYADLSLVRDPATQAIIGPNTARILFLPLGTETAPSLQSWSESELPGSSYPELATKDNDLDGIPNLLEYILGTSPTLADPPGKGDLSMALVAGRIELSLDTQVGLSGIELDILTSSKFTIWNKATSSFTATYRMLGNNRLRQTFVSQPIHSLPDQQYYQLRATVVERLKP